jgi:FkbM family methyltransferase
MLPFRARFALHRIASPSYYHRLSKVVSSPFRFYWILFRKIRPGSSEKPLDLRLKDGKTLNIYEFWALYLFDEVMIENCYEPAELMHSAPFNTIIDVGANIGLFTLRTKQLWPKANVISIEPHPKNFERLTEHIALNKLDGTKPLQVGIAEKCGCFDLYISPRNTAGHSMYKKDGDSKSISIPTCTLTDVMADFDSTDSNTLLKIDCEGCEFPLLSSLTQEVANRISCIIFEPENSLYDLDILLQKLAGFGYKITKSSNLVVASR